ncbi:MAG: hypothetical protein DID91_2727704777 [Candidatus Nitrotoga sp. MKT]|nr:MAG: hypothetical protein DID91_2727704777 [Candidatus Nitrotoga sp. MKT]
MDTSRNWTPNDWIRLVALIGAFGLFGLGAWMLFLGIAAEGTIDLKSSILSGTIKASSAGLYICFFALFIIVFVLASLLSLPRSSSTSPASRARRLMPIFWGMLGALVLCAIAAAFTPQGARTGLIMVITTLTMGIIPVVIDIVRVVSNDA